jgi:hypothetical protein
MKALDKVESLGSYMPSFFLLKVSTTESLLDINNLTNVDKATFFHEYVHFLQDLFTLFGLRNINYFVNKVYGLHQIAIKKQPIIFPLNKKDLTKSELDELFDIYYGTYFLGDDIDFVFKTNVYDNGYIKTKEHIKIIDVECFSSKYKCHDAFSLGAFVILESMAYMIEKKHFGDYNAPNFPYKIVDLIIDSLYADLNLSAAERIAICEESLNSAHPGYTFILLLDKIRELKIDFPTPNDIHLFCQRSFFLQDEHGVKSNIHLYCINELKKAQDNLKIYFTKDDVVKVNLWIDLIFNTSKVYKEKGFHFYKLYESFDYFVEVINTVGTPLIANDIEYYFQNPKLDQADCHIAMFTAIKEFMEISLGNKVNCDLKSLCNKGPVKLVNANCDNAPWLNKTLEPKCFFGTLMFLWQL